MAGWPPEIDTVAAVAYNAVCFHLVVRHGPPRADAGTRVPKHRSSYDADPYHVRDDPGATRSAWGEGLSVHPVTAVPAYRVVRDQTIKRILDLDTVPAIPQPVVPIAVCPDEVAGDHSAISRLVGEDPPANTPGLLRRDDVVADNAVTGAGLQQHGCGVPEAQVAIPGSQTPRYVRPHVAVLDQIPRRPSSLDTYPATREALDDQAAEDVDS